MTHCDGHELLGTVAQRRGGRDAVALQTKGDSETGTLTIAADFLQ